MRDDAVEVFLRIIFCFTLSKQMIGEDLFFGFFDSYNFFFLEANNMQNIL